MVKFEVNYNGKWYKYEGGWIHELKRCLNIND